MIEVSIFEEKDLEKIEPFEPRDLSFLESKAKTIGPNSQIRTFWHNDKITAIMGITKLWEHVAEAWSVQGKSLAKIAISHVRATREIIEWAERNMDLHRVHITVRERYRKWGKLLGFKEEAKMRKFFSDGSDCYLLSRVRDGH